MAILTCPGCGRGGLRVPDGRRGKVTCPTCGAEWFHPETVEFSEVEFRCSKSGARFTVTCSRRSPLHKFVIKEITKAASAATRPPMESSPASPQAVPPDAVLPSLPLPASKMVGWFARIAGRKTNLVATRSVSAPVPMQEPSGVSAEVSMHDASEYNWSGFACPYCSAASFVRCAGGHLTCDGAAELRSGRRFHQCFCGAAGFISGAIQSVEGKQRSVAAEVGAATPPTPTTQGLSAKPTEIALPSPMKGGRPARQ